jgi:hypothetical protein
MWRDSHSKDYQYQDRRIKELLTAGGVGVNINKYLGPNDQGPSDDYTKPSTTNATEKSIQDLLFLENRDRKYDRNVYPMRCHYTIMDTDFNLSQFGLFVTNDTLFFTFHINDMIERMGRKIMPGDVLELPHLRDYNPLDPNDVIPVPLRKYYVVQETTRAAEGFAQTWWPHLWRVKAQPMVDGQEYRDILNQDASDVDDPAVNQNPLRDYLSTYALNVNIDDAIIAQAQKDVPLSGYDTKPLYVLPLDENGVPQINSSQNTDTTYVTTDSERLSTDYTFISPQSTYAGYLTGDGTAPNGLPVQPLTYFPEYPQLGDYVLRLDYYPNRLFRWDGRNWVAISDAVRNNLTGANNQNQLGTYFNNSANVTIRNGTTVPSKAALSQILKPNSGL